MDELSLEDGDEVFEEDAQVAVSVPARDDNRHPGVGLAVAWLPLAAKDEVRSHGLRYGLPRHVVHPTDKHPAV